jgi:hypothetical protein
VSPLESHHKKTENGYASFLILKILQAIIISKSACKSETAEKLASLSARSFPGEIYR